jgi:hypothetical protein
VIVDASRDDVALIKSKMAETGSPLAGEMSGHIFFADRWYGFDDALYAAVRTLGIVARMDGKLSAVRDALPHVINTPEVRFDCDDRRKFAVIEEVAGRLQSEGATAAGESGLVKQLGASALAEPDFSGSHSGHCTKTRKRRYACRAKLARYKHPRRFASLVLDELPPSATGKIQRHELEKWLSQANNCSNQFTRGSSGR